MVDRYSVASRSNGEALYAIKTTWTGLGIKHLVARAVITPKRVEVATNTWEKATGKRVSRYVEGAKYQTLLAYRYDGEAALGMPWRYLPGVIDL